MAIEIERKYLVSGDFMPDVCHSERIVQGYISAEPGCTVRIRIFGEKGFLTIKGSSGESGLSRSEFEYEIPLADAEELFSLCKPGVIEKKRYRAVVDSHTWEIDVFSGLNEGLVLAEIELDSEEEVFVLPAWVGKEVTGDSRYYNSMLACHPYKEWASR